MRNIGKLCYENIKTHGGYLSFAAGSPVCSLANQSPGRHEILIYATYMKMFLNADLTFRSQLPLVSKFSELRLWHEEESKITSTAQIPDSQKTGIW